MDTFNVYVIHSDQPLEEFKLMLNKCGGFKYVGIIYKSIAFRDGSRSRKEETKKTIVMCPETTIQEMKSRHPEYQNPSVVADYKWESFPNPNPGIGESSDLHVSGVPNDYTVREAEELVVRSLAPILSEKNDQGTCNFKISFRARLRETGEINGYGHIIFDKSVPFNTIRLCKLILHNTYVPFKKNSSEKRMVTCTWHRQPGSETTKRIPRMTKASDVIRRYQPAVTVDVSKIRAELDLTPTVAHSK